MSSSSSITPDPPLPPKSKEQSEVSAVQHSHLASTHPQTGIIPAGPQPADTQHTARLNHYHRCVIFFIIEAAYIALASSLLHKTHTIPYFSDRFSANTVKSATGTAFLLWHTLAIIFVSDILTDAFSREWLANRTSPTDCVSTIKAGTVDRIRHLPRSTMTFKLSLLTSCFAFVLLRIGANTITTTEVGEAIVNIGGLLMGTSQRSHTILNAEQVLGLNLGFNVQPNWVIPKPAATPPGGNLEYNSDLIHFNHSCQWLVPQFTDVSPTVGYVLIGGESFWFARFAELNRTAMDITTPGTAVYSLYPDTPSSTSAFVIFGGNSTYPLNSDSLTRNATTPLSIVGVRATGNTIDLSGLPTLYNASWFNFSGDRFSISDGRSLVFRAPLATALYCNPSAQLTTGRVRLAANNLTVASSGDTHRVNNIDNRNIPRYFSWAFDGVGNSVDSFILTNSTSSQSQLLVDFTALAQHLLLPSNSKNSISFNASIPPLPLDNIERNMDAFMLSVSKAQQVDGVEDATYRDIPVGSGVMALSATLLGPKPILASSLLWLSATTFTALATLCLCLVISFRLGRDLSPPFDLANISQVFNAQKCPTCQGCQLQK